MFCAYIHHRRIHRKEVLSSFQAFSLSLSHLERNEVISATSQLAVSISVLLAPRHFSFYFTLFAKKSNYNRDHNNKLIGTYNTFRVIIVGKVQFS